MDDSATPKYSCNHPNLAWATTNRANVDSVNGKITVVGNDGNKVTVCRFSFTDSGNKFRKFP